MTRLGDPSAQLPTASRASVRAAVLRHMRANVRALCVMVTVNGLAATAGLLSPWLLGRIIDNVQDGGDLAAVDRLGAAVLGFAVAHLILTRFASYLGSRFGERIQAAVREEYLDRVLNLAPKVAEQAGVGDLTARGTIDVSLVGETLREALPATVIATLQVGMIVIAAIIIDPLLGASGVLGLAGLAASARWYLRRSREAYLTDGAAKSQLGEQLTQSAIGARTIDALSLQEQRKQACEEAIEANNTAQARTLRLRSVLYPSVDVSTAIPPVLVLVIGSYLLQQGRVTIGDVVAATLYMQLLGQPVATLLMWIEQLQSAGASFARVEGIADAHKDVDTDAPDVVPSSERLEASNVCFAYRHGQDVLADISLSLLPGERLALVGPSGAGKTTLGRLLAGTDRPRSGTVTLGGVPVADLTPEALREHVLLVTQDQHLFHGTLRDNLLLASPESGDPELLAAMETVDAAWVRSLPEGLATEVGSGGYRLDPGQVQQVALARIVLADPHTVILDEATSLLDPVTARRTERSLAAALDGRTIVAIAHRLQTARDATRVAVMLDGRLVEVGSHDELIESGNDYAKLWSSWVGRG